MAEFVPTPIKERTRHLGQIRSTKEDIIIFGYYPVLNQVLACAVDALPQTDSNNVYQIAMSPAAQDRFFLISEEISDSPLGLIHQATQLSYFNYLLQFHPKSIKYLRMDDVIFFDKAQKSHFLGFHANKEEEVEGAARFEKYDTAEGTVGLSDSPSPEPMKSVGDDQMSVIVSALEKITNRLDAIEAKETAAAEPAPAPVKARKKPGPKPGSRRKKPAATAPVEETEE